MNKNKRILFVFSCIFIILEILIFTLATYENNPQIDANGFIFAFKTSFASVFVFLSLLFIYKTISSSWKLKSQIEKTEVMANNLRAINRNFAGVLNSINAIIYVSDVVKHEVIFANNYAIAKFGEMIGRDSYLATNNPYESREQNVALSTYEYYNELTKEWYAVTEKLGEWMDGKSVKIFICLDITARKDAEEKLKEINENLEAMVEKSVMEIRKKDKLLIQQSKMAAMGEMIGAIAHQWRQPLNALGLMIQDIKLSYQLNDLDEKYLDRLTTDAMAQVKYMSKTIDDFRNFFRPDKPKAPFGVNKAVLEVLKIADLQLKNNKIEVVTEFADEELIVDGYENEFKQVVLNLITNAKDAIVEKLGAGNKGGKIEIRTYKNKEGMAILTVTDNGGGILSDILEKIFEPYFTTKDQTKGTGIGLYMCKMIIEDNMNGLIFALNEPNGARFQIELAAIDKKEDSA
jgi:signal transduction histidine kinase